ncbi:ABC transporter permease [Cohnella nanjingensis]|uniref:Sugar ABC transporter permease n=1 Tax=Cohnella nanjingensis TaxID=1387779 RepID=A0A7X0RTA4_9BACL|nr:ABC transporter permease subunit [Cohnella nanjingensis]MBB6671794.1 sugar ABC transporter permease [Cohnella nanjingensis]
MPKAILKHKFIYLMILPTFIYFLVFSYVPMIGIIIAFKDIQLFKGIWASPWVGLEHFRTFFSSIQFNRLMGNTLTISLSRILFGFPIPILFALLLNEVRIGVFKKAVQTITYFPHFLSWVIFGGIIYNLLGPIGAVNLILDLLGMEKIDFMTNPSIFRGMLIVTGILKEFGWGAIIYLAALSGIDGTLYEAARIDGAGKLRQIWHITLPGIRSTIVLMFVLSLAGIMDAGMEQILILANPLVYSTSDIIDTYVYRIGLQESNFGLATAVGLFKGVIGTILIVLGNMIVRRTGERSIW